MPIYSVMATRTTKPPCIPLRFPHQQVHGVCKLTRATASKHLQETVPQANGRNFSRLKN